MNTQQLLDALASVLSQYIDKNGLLYFKNKLDAKFATKAEVSNKVDKIEGKQLSTNDYTNDEKNKLAGLKNYSLPKASSEILGGIKVGAGLAIDGEGNLSATGGGTADAVAWENVIGKPTKVSQFENDSNFQTSSQVESIITSKGYQTESQVRTIVNNAQHMKREIVEELPDPSSANELTIYLIANEKGSYDEYMLINGKMDKVGASDVDLTGYFNATNFLPVSNEDIDSMFS